MIALSMSSAKIVHAREVELAFIADHSAILGASEERSSFFVIAFMINDDNVEVGIAGLAFDALKASG